MFMTFKHSVTSSSLGRKGPVYTLDSSLTKVSLMFNRFRVSIWDDEKVLEMGSGDGCPTVKTYLMPLNYTLNIVQVAIFYVMYILPQLFFFKVLLHGRQSFSFP